MCIPTVTMCPPESEKSSRLCTQVMSVGKSSDNHTPFIDWHLTQANGLMSGLPCCFFETNEIGCTAVAMIG